MTIAQVRSDATSLARSPLYRDGLALMGNAGLTSILGVVYWAVAARLVTPAVIGVNAALVAALMAISNVGQLSLGAAFVSFLPRLRGDRRPFVRHCYVLAMSASAALAVAFVVVAPFVIGDLHVLRQPAVALFFIGGVVVWSLFVLQDNVLTALRLAVWIPIENVGYSAAKLIGLVVVAGSLAGVGIFVSWVVPAAIALAPVNLIIFRRLLGSGGETVAERPAAFGRFVASDAFGMVLAQVSTTALPLLVLARLGAGEAALFAIPWLLAQSIDHVAVSMGMSLAVEGSQRPDELATLYRGVRRRVLGLLTVGAAAGLVAAPFVLSMYGGAYGGTAVTCLRILFVAAIPRALLVLTVCAARAALKPARVVALQLATAIAVPTAAWLLMGWYGPAGAALGWAVGQLAAVPIALSVSPEVDA